MPRKLRLEFPGAMYHIMPGGRQMERRRLEEVDETFRKECLEQIEGKVGENHPGEIRHETAEAKAERLLISKELGRLQWNQQDPAARSKSDPRKLATAVRLRQETTLSIKQIAERLHLGKPKGAKTNLHKRLNHPAPTNSEFQLGL